MDYGVKIFDISKDLKTQGFLDSMLSRQSSIEDQAALEVLKLGRKPNCPDETSWLCNRSLNTLNNIGTTDMGR